MPGKKTQIDQANTDQRITDKLLFTKVDGCSGAFLLSGNRLTSASLFTSAEKITGGIYIARVKEYVKNLNACFVEIQKDRICFLEGKEMQSPFILSNPGSKPKEERVLKQGDLVLVQGLREAQKTKQPAVTTRISLSNPCFAISLGPNRIGFSAKLSKERRESIQTFLRETPYIDDNGCLKPLWQLGSQQEAGILREVPSAGLIARTECGRASAEELQNALEDLLREFRELLTSAFYRSAFTCLKPAPRQWQEALTNLVIPGEPVEIVTDDAEIYKEIADSGIADSNLAKPSLSLRLYEDSEYPLEKLYSLRTKLKDALGTRVWLRSGAYLIVEPTEALTVIDVNSGKFESHREDAAYIRSVNLEAADEIARQIRLRNLSGMILVDFINMTSKKDQEELIGRVQRAVRSDRVKTSVIDFTKLGLMEITRQKKDAPLEEQGRAAGFSYRERDS